MFCTIQDVRRLSKKISEIDIPDTEITDYIAIAQNVVLVDLSDYASTEQLSSLENSLALNLLCTYKTCELLLAAYYGASRKIDEVSDIQFFQKLYNTLLKNILNGNVKIAEISLQAKSYPALDKKRNKFYPVKGIKEFYGDDDYSNVDIEVDE